MSGTNDTVTERGRMINRLRGVWREKRTGRWSRNRTTRRWSDEEIRQALGLSQEEFKEAVDAYEIVKPKSWSTRDAHRAYQTFVLREKRWPRVKDFKRVNGLPSQTGLRWIVRDNFAAAQREMVAKRELWKKMTPELILSIPNLTVRRDAMRKYGIERLIRNGGGEKVQSDTFGTLWRLPTDGADPHQHYVEVVNSTPRVNEETGQVVLRRGKPVYDHYFLRVPPTVSTAREAVAWGYGRDPSTFTGFDSES